MTKEKAKEIIEIIDKRYCTLDKEERQALTVAIKLLEKAPKTGHWIEKDGSASAVCSCCNRNNTLYGDFCKWCGAKMVEPKERGVYK